MPTQGEDQFKHHFDISMNHPRNFTTHYNSQFYTKNDDKVCKLVFLFNLIIILSKLILYINLGISNKF